MGQLSMIDPQKGLFSKIECRRYDILIPFVCLKSGRRCKSYMPSIPERNLMILAHDLHREEADMFREYSLCYRKSMTSHPVPCIFKSQNNLCLIYNHPLRPDVCRLYPFSFGGADETCPGYQEHHRLVELLTSREWPCRTYDSSFCPNLVLRCIPDQNWQEILETFRKGRPRPELEKKFIEWNHQPQGGRNANPHPNQRN
jgi:Fe-S-cluster containining protein